jgi:hypothetical protein
MDTIIEARENIDINGGLGDDVDNEVAIQVEARPTRREVLKPANTLTS